MFTVVLFEPEIPPNTGNLMRLTVNTGCSLHLVEPLGFTLDDARMRRAGLDYRDFADVVVHSSFSDFLDVVDPETMYAFTQHGDALYTDVAYREGDVLLFGRESDGLPESVMRHPRVTARLRIPIAPKGRSLNLANAAAIGVYEAWRQHGFRTP